MSQVLSCLGEGKQVICVRDFCQCSQTNDFKEYGAIKVLGRFRLHRHFHYNKSLILQ